MTHDQFVRWMACLLAAEVILILCPLGVGAWLLCGGGQ